MMLMLAASKMTFNIKHNREQKTDRIEPQVTDFVCHVFKTEQGHAVA
jgi:hypothetical protein